MLDQKSAEKLKRACRKERKAFNDLCDCAKGEERDCCEAYRKAKKARKNLEAKLESA